MVLATGAAALVVLMSVAIASMGATAERGVPSAHELPVGTIHWLFRHLPRGQSLSAAHIARGSTVGAHWQPLKFARVLTPDPKSEFRLVVSLIGKHGRNICLTLFDQER